MSNTTNDVVIEARNFSCRIGDKDILRDVSCQVRRGEYVSIVGPNGAGKTTLLKAFDRIMIGRVSGELYLCATAWKDWKQSELAKRAALVPQADSRVLPFAVEQFLLMCRYPYMSPFAGVRTEDREAVRRAMADAGVAVFAGRRMDTLSSGERQRVYIAAALAQGAGIWLLDEPTTFLDYRHQEEILALVASANKEFGVTVVAVTHDLNNAALYSDRIFALSDGELVFCGTPREIMEPDAIRRIYGTSLLMVEHPQTGLPMIVPRSSVKQNRLQTGAQSYPSTSSEEKTQ
jgi:iron complex transport system ATP-binding protein